MSLIRSCFALAALGLAVYAHSATSFGEDLFSGFESGWSESWMERAMARRSNTIQLESENENRFLRVDSRESASALWRRIDLDVTHDHVVSWKWRVSNTLGHIENERRKGSDDYAARVAVMFDGKPFDRDTPFLMYVWASKEAVGTVYPSPYTKNAATIVLRSGDLDSGKWQMEERNMLADFERYFGRPAEKITAVALMVDTDNTDSRATAWFDELRIRGEALR